MKPKCARACADMRFVVSNDARALSTTISCLSMSRFVSITRAFDGLFLMVNYGMSRPRACDGMARA